MLSNPVVEGIDCLCNIITTADLACKKGLFSSPTLLYAGLTGLDCTSTSLGALFGCPTGAVIGGVGGVPGAIVGCFLGAKFGDIVIDTVAFALQNYITQDTVLPCAQIEACKSVYQKLISPPPIYYDGPFPSSGPILATFGKSCGPECLH